MQRSYQKTRRELCSEGKHACFFKTTWQGCEGLARVKIMMSTMRKSLRECYLSL